MTDGHWIHWSFCNMHCSTNQGLVDKLGAEYDRGEMVKGQTSYLSVIL